MNITEVNKIQKLIVSSPILSPKEREEWQELVELMDDKQLLELERILSPEVGRPNISENQKIGTPTPTLPSGGEGGTEVVSAQPQSQMPKLSHITNLPKVSQEQSAILKVQLPPAQKQPSAFEAKLKSVLEEKELPASPVELELPPRDAAKPELKVPVPPMLRVETAKSAAPLPVPPAKVPGLANSLPVSEAPQKQELAIDHALNLQVKAAAASPQKPLPTAEAPITQKPQTQPEATPVANFNLNNLQDLSLIEPGVLKTLPLEELAQKIKSIIGAYGYFEAVFQIEKSPAYKNYIDTGIKILSGHAKFGSGADLLTKSEFEKFTDLLAKIQSN